MRLLRSCLVLLAVSACGSSSTAEPGDASSSDATSSAGAGGSGGAGIGGGSVDGSTADSDSGGGAGGSAGAAGSGPRDASTFDGDARADATLDVASDVDETGAGISYFGCTFIGGIDRLVVTKSDPGHNFCFTLVLDNPGQAPAGLTLPPRFGLESATAGVSSSCRTRASVAVVASATQVTGIVAGPDAGLAEPREVNVDVTFSFGSNDAGIPASERLNVQGLDVQPACL